MFLYYDHTVNRSLVRTLAVSMGNYGVSEVAQELVNESSG